MLFFSLHSFDGFSEERAEVNVAMVGTDPSASLVDVDLECR